MLKETSAVIDKAIKAGKTLGSDEEGEASCCLERNYSNDFIDTDAFIDTLYNSLTHQQYTTF